ncbi:MAG TPA: winged helix-turn-helix domain-containing protein [Actinomycetota bacterium]|nr:winged helix-turn-helix domain-containing protein [Actinomycetota bacterium]
MARAERRMEVTDGAVLAALAHPLRVALLYQLNALGSRTASQCAQALGETPANCSYHLRQLAKAGLVARDEAGNGRERPWRSVYTGLSLRPPVDDADPEVVTAARATRAALANAEIEEHARLARQYLRLEPRAAKAWRDVAGVNSYSLRLTAEELAGLEAALDAAIRPYIGLTRADPPEDAQPVHLDFKAFLRPEALA